MFKSIALFFSKQGVTIIALLLISLSGAYYIERTKRVSLEQSVNKPELNDLIWNGK